MKVKCPICPHGCMLDRNETGFCRARSNRDGKIVSINYGQITSLALDPVEKKPLYHFYPGEKILSVGSFGCNLCCGFCQNHSISMMGKEARTVFISPEELAERALGLVPAGNIGVAYTYNEPLIGYEYVADCAGKIRASGLKNVLVTNGYVCEEPLRALLPDIDAMNIDLKSFRAEFYDKLAGGLETVKHTIRLAQEVCHIEITTLIIPGENDREDEIIALAQWLAAINPEIPLHLSRFFPQYRYDNRTATPVATVYRLAEIAGAYLKHVYTGNC